MELTGGQTAIEALTRKIEPVIHSLHKHTPGGRVKNITRSISNKRQEIKAMVKQRTVKKETSTRSTTGHICL